MKPYTINETSKRINQGVPFNHAIKEFLDGIVIYKDKQSLLLDEPDNIVVHNPYLSDNVYNTLLAGIACEISDRYSLECPSWTRKPKYYLDKAVFTCNENKEKRALLLSTTPSYYRARNLFCGKIITVLGWDDE